MNDNLAIPEQPTEPNELRRQMDNFYLSRFADMGKSIDRLQVAFENSLRAASEIQGNQARMIDRITAFNERFIEHDEREGEDRRQLIAALKQINSTISNQDRQIERHAEAISTLKLWDMLLAAAMGALATGGVGWIIHHLQATVTR